MSDLRWKVFVTPGVPTVSDDLPPGKSARMWSPITSTLIYGDRDAVLVDTPTIEAQAVALADWVAASGRNLTAIYATHALRPQVVIAGHKRESNGDGPEVIEQFRQCVCDFDRLIEATTSTKDLYEAMLEVYPNRVNRGALWGSARAIKG